MSFLLTGLLFPIGQHGRAESVPVNGSVSATEPHVLFPRKGNHYFRIPGLVITRQGTLIAFAGERKGSIQDFGRDTDVVMRRSTDGGETWSDIKTILTQNGIDYHSGPAVADLQTGSVFKFSRSHGATTKAGTDWRENVVLRSDDDGETWTAQILPLTHPAAIRRFGPDNGGHGIQLTDGRLVVQGGYRNTTEGNGRSLCLIESADHGKTWRIMEHSTLDEAHVEFGVEELVQGRLYFNIRETVGTERLQATLDPRVPATFSLSPAGALPGARCHVGLTAIRSPEGIVLYCSGPIGVAKRTDYEESARIDLTLFRSMDGGMHWENAGLLHAGKSAYSDLAAINDSMLACLYETGTKRPDEEIHFIRIPLETNH